MGKPRNLVCDFSHISHQRWQSRSRQFWTAVYISIEADDLAIEHAAPTLQVATKSLAQTGDTLERVSVTRDKPNWVLLGIEGRVITVTCPI